MPDFVLQRRNMVEAQVRSNDVTDSRLIAALGSVPRERFIPVARHAIAYADVPVEVAPRRFLLDPRSLAKLIQLAKVEPNDRVLDVGTATGYSAAILGRLAKEVVALEQDADLVRLASDTLQSVGARNVTVVQGSLSDGVKASAPFDVIFVNGSIAQEPQALLAQLAQGGRLVTIIQKDSQGRAHLFLRTPQDVGVWPDFDATVPALAGFRAPVGFVF